MFLPATHREHPGKHSLPFSPPDRPHLPFWVVNLALGVSLLAIAFLVSGCVQANMTNPPRSATEQLLLSTAADRALANADYSIFSDKKVYLDATYFDSYDSKYVLGAIRDTLSSAGARIVNESTNCDIIVECRSGAYSIDSRQSLIGIPTTTAPVPLAGSVVLPEIALYKSERQRSYAKFALLAYSATSHEHLYSSGPLLGKSYNNFYKFIGLIYWTFTDIPEKHKHHQQQ